MNKRLLGLLALMAVAVFVVSPLACSCGDDDDDDSASDDDNDDTDDDDDDSTTDDDTDVEKECLLERSVSDRDCDGPTSKDLCYEYEYNDDGLLMKIVVDIGCDEVIDSCSPHEYDADGRLTLIRSDKDCDGPEGDTCTYYDYSEDGLTVAISNDSDCVKGDFFQCTEETMNEDGQITLYKLDVGCDGSYELISKTTFDDRGRPQTYQSGDDENPAAGCSEVTYTDTDEGYDAIIRSDEGCDDSAESCMEESYNADGLMTSQRRDNGCDKTGYADCVVWEYSEAGQIILREDDPECDDSPSYCLEAGPLDENGQRDKVDVDSDCDGSADECIDYDYSCA